MSDEPRPLAAMLDTPDLGALARPTSSEVRPAVSASGLTPQALGSAITALLGQIQAAAQARIARAGQMTQGPFHRAGGIDQAAGGALGVLGTLGISGDKVGPLVRLFRGETNIKSGGGPESLRGRWFFDSEDKAKTWAAASKRPVMYVDVPAEQVEQFRVSNMPKSLAHSYSLDPGAEFLIPRDLADLARPLEAQAAAGNVPMLDRAKIGPPRSAIND